MPKFIAWNNSSPTARPPLVVIDIGDSESDQSCGVWHDGATVPNSCQFYRAIELATAQLNAALALDARPLLVIEAPLSRAHTARGNPTPRGDFENARRWYVQSGAMVTLAAIRLLEVVSAKLTDDIWIAEAFLSNKDESTAHWRDAMEIHTQFWSIPPIIPGAAEICPLCGLIDGVPDVRVFAVNADEALLPPS
ncbi:MAG TPA: hypothetical protein VME17_04935 [Bryobacteraceae bacterium]|nr:hypothetical protein [Bryobacteraceae bacterium]